MLWRLPYPSLLTTFHPTELDALVAEQRRAFVPASHHVAVHTGRTLKVIKVYSSFGNGAGIQGFGFFYDDDTETIWGSADDAATAAFFVQKSEQIQKVVVISQGFMVHHVQVSLSSSSYRLSNAASLHFEVYYQSEQEKSTVARSSTMQATF